MTQPDSTTHAISAPLFSARQQKIWETLQSAVPQAFPNVSVDFVGIGGQIREMTLLLPAESAGHYRALVLWLRDDSRFSFKTLIDVCGIDYSAFGEPLDRQELIAEGKIAPSGAHSPYPNRYAVVAHLLSIENNVRLRIKVLVPDDDFPVVDSLTPIHPSADWFEREAFDLYGIAFNDHEDLRRILTDYGFIGHPFRKDFPVSGYVEMRYDSEQQRVIYQPVSIPRRDLKPREVRPGGFAQ